MSEIRVSGGDGKTVVTVDGLSGIVRLEISPGQLHYGAVLTPREARRIAVQLIEAAERADEDEGN